MTHLSPLEWPGGRYLGEGNPCYIVAEIGQNHNGCMATARQLIDAAADAGVDAVKFCKRDLASELTTEAFHQPYDNPHSYGPTYGEHRRALELSREQHAELSDYAAARGVTYFSTACDARSVEDLELIEVPFYKVASRDLTNLPLLECIAATGKPVVLSCGMDGPDAIEQALVIVRRAGSPVVLLQCTSSYPTAPADVNLRVIPALRQQFGVHIGYSDHTLGGAVALGAVALGAVMIEKHITLDRNQRGRDHACSLTPAELKQFVADIRTVESALGDGIKRVPESVAAAKARLGRSLVSRCEIPRGMRVTEDMLCLKSAGCGLPWQQRQLLLGRVARRDIPADAAISLADFE